MTKPKIHTKEMVVLEIVKNLTRRDLTTSEARRLETTLNSISGVQLVSVYDGKAVVEALVQREDIPRVRVALIQRINAACDLLVGQRVPASDRR